MSVIVNKHLSFYCLVLISIDIAGTLMNFLKKLFNKKALTQKNTLKIIDQSAPNIFIFDKDIKTEALNILTFRDNYPLLKEQSIIHMQDLLNQAELQDFNRQLTIFWLLHLRDSLGIDYKLYQSDEVFLLSSQNERIIKLTMDFLKSGRERVLKALPGLTAAFGDLLAIMINEGEQYYDYTGKYNSGKGQTILSAGVFIKSVLPHFVTNETQLTLAEPTIIHEMTHYHLAHLELPLWLDEGLAVNVERVIAKNAPPAEYLVELYEKHIAYWDHQTIQNFWSGDTYSHSTKAELAYDLGRMLVYHLAKHKHAFKQFVEDSNRLDSGAKAAMTHLDMTLGQIVCSLLNKPYNTRWEPKAYDLTISYH